jgi:YcaO-like protein with predicted kinase domain
MSEGQQSFFVDNRQMPNGQVAQTYVSGVHRMVDPATTLARVKPLFGEIGLTRIANVTGLDIVGIPVVSVCRPNARSNAVCQGKGLTLDAAKASGVMESIETYCAEHIVRPVLFASAREVARQHQIVDSERLCRVSGSSLSPDTRIMWIEGRDIVSSELRMLPFELVHADFSVPRPPGSGYFLLSTNGLASGNSMPEAILHGTCEVIERDAATLFSLDYRLSETRRLDLDSVNDYACHTTLMKLVNAGLVVAVWDITTDIGVAAFRCQIMERTAGDQGVTIPAEGHGCHPNRAVALVRALTEAAQTRVTAISGARDDIGPGLYGLVEDPSLLERWRNSLYSTKGKRQFLQVPSANLGTTEDELAHVLLCLSSAGFADVIMVDLSPSPSEFCAVVRIVVPGLEGPLHHHYAPGLRGRAHVKKFQ